MFCFIFSKVFNVFYSSEVDSYVVRVIFLSMMLSEGIEVGVSSRIGCLIMVVDDVGNGGEYNEEIKGLGGKCLVEVMSVKDFGVGDGLVVVECYFFEEYVLEDWLE